MPVQNEGSEEISNQVTPQQLAFLRRHGIPMSRVFDAFGYSQPEWRAEMSIHEMVVAINVRPCRKAGHTLRTSGGHCAQCRPGNLAFQERYREEAFVYIADAQIRALSGHKTASMTALYTKATKRQRQTGARKRLEERTKGGDLSK